MTTYYLNIYPDGGAAGHQDEEAVRRNAGHDATRVAVPVEVPDPLPPTPKPGSVWISNRRNVLVLVDRVEDFRVSHSAIEDPNIKVWSPLRTWHERFIPYEQVKGTR